MGKCLSKTEKRIYPSKTNNTLKLDSLAQSEHDIELLILELHNLSLECKWAYQEVLLNFSLEKALFIKAKEILINKELEVLRELLTLTENFMKSGNKNYKEHLKVQKNIHEVISCIDREILKNNIKEIMGSSKVDNKKLIEVLAKSNISKNDIQIQIEADLRKIANAQNSSNLQRKTYRRRR